MPGQYLSYFNGSYCQENVLLTGERLTLSIILYVDDLEIANPLGTSKKIHKISAAYWALANLPIKYRSSLHALQLCAIQIIFQIKFVLHLSDPEKLSGFLEFIQVVLVRLNDGRKRLKLKLKVLIFKL